MGARVRVLERGHKMALPIMPCRVQGLVYTCNPSTKKAEAGGSLGVEAWSHGSSRAVTELLFLRTKPTITLHSCHHDHQGIYTPLAGQVSSPGIQRHLFIF